MNKRVSFNLQILVPEKTFISAISSAALYGRGIFTSLAIYKAKPFLWEKHWRRLSETSAKLGINLTEFNEDAVNAALRQLIAENNFENGRARLTFFDESAGKLWNFETKRKTSLLITTAEFQKAKDAYLLTVSPFPVNSKSPLAGVKSCNYLENLLAFEEAAKRGFDEAVRLNERDEIVSAATANIFWEKDDEIFTPALETGCLAGTTREFFMENFPVRETKSEIGDLFAADEIFLTSAGIGVRPAWFQSGEMKKSPTLVKFNELLDLHKFKT
jgi:branched-subunit amino acid aminotransferase/4-amino-4-deoxychorismate lyase